MATMAYGVLLVAGVLLLVSTLVRVWIGGLDGRRGASSSEVDAVEPASAEQRTREEGSR